MSDWERAARNAVTTVFPGIHLHGCHFHFAQNIWRKLQKLGLATIYHNNDQFKRLVRAMMALPFLPASSIFDTFNLIESQSLTLNQDSTNKFRLLKVYIRNQWMIRTPANELSIYTSIQTTNNGAEIYHGKLKSEIVVNRPRIWFFIQTMNDIISDTDIDIERMRSGIEITRPRKKKDRDNDMQRRECKNKLEGGEFTPLQYLFALTHTIEPITIETSDMSSSDSNEDNSDVILESDQRHLCCVCLEVRETTMLIYPCRHAKTCQRCTQQLRETCNQCPICRATIGDCMQIFT